MNGEIVVQRDGHRKAFSFLLKHEEKEAPGHSMQVNDVGLKLINNLTATLVNITDGLQSSPVEHVLKGEAVDDGAFKLKGLNYCAFFPVRDDLANVSPLR